MISVSKRYSLLVQSVFDLAAVEALLQAAVEQNSLASHNLNRSSTAAVTLLHSQQAQQSNNTRTIRSSRKEDAASNI